MMQSDLVIYGDQEFLRSIHREVQSEEDVLLIEGEAVGRKDRIQIPLSSSDDNSVHFESVKEKLNSFLPWIQELSIPHHPDWHLLIFCGFSVEWETSQYMWIDPHLTSLLGYYRCGLGIHVVPEETRPE